MPNTISHTKTGTNRTKTNLSKQRGQNNVAITNKAGCLSKISAKCIRGTDCTSPVFQKH